MNKILYPSHFKLFSQLTAEQVFQIISKIGNEAYTLSDPVCLGIWMSMSRDFENQQANYEKKVEANRLNGKKGGRPVKTQNNPENPVGYLETQKTHHNPQNLKDKAKAIDKARDKVKEDIKEEIKVDSNTETIGIFEDADSYLDNLLKTKEELLKQQKAKEVPKKPLQTSLPLVEPLHIPRVKKVREIIDFASLKIDDVLSND